GVVSGLGVVHVAAGGRDFRLIGLEIQVEMRERVVLDVARRVAQRIELGQPVRHLAPARDEVDLNEFERVLQLGVGERRPRIVLGGGGGRGGGQEGVGSWGWVGGPIAGSVIIPASTSATCRTSTVLPSRWSLPAMFMRQPRSPAIRRSAPVAATLAAFLPTMALEMLGYLTQKVPPKPQHTSASRMSLSTSPRTEPSRRRGCTRTPSSRRPEQASS